MTDAPAADLRDHIAVHAALSKIGREFPIANPKIFHLAMLIENGWWRHRYPDSDAQHVEAVCRRYFAHPDSFPNLEVQP